MPIPAMSFSMNSRGEVRLNSTVNGNTITLSIPDLSSSHNFSSSVLSRRRPSPEPST